MPRQRRISARSVESKVTDTRFDGRDGGDAVVTAVMMVVVRYRSTAAPITPPRGVHVRNTSVSGTCPLQLATW